MRKSHTRKRQTVGDLSEVHLTLVKLHIYAEQVSLGSHPLVKEAGDIVAEGVKQLHIACGEPFLSFERHYEPVGGIDIIDDIVIGTVTHGSGGFLAGISQLVESHNLASHEYRLGERQCPGKYIVDVKGQRVLGKQSHLGGYRLAIDYDRLPGVGVLDHIKLVALRCKVERLDRQIGILGYYGKIFLIIHICSGEVNGRQISRTSLTLGVFGSLQLGIVDARLLAVGYRQVAALLQSHDRLSRNTRHQRRAKQNQGNQTWHIANNRIFVDKWNICDK